MTNALKFTYSLHIYRRCFAGERKIVLNFAFKRIVLQRQLSQWNHWPGETIWIGSAHIIQTPHTLSIRIGLTPDRPSDQWARKIFHSWKSWDSCVQTLGFLLLLLFCVCHCESVLLRVIPLVVFVAFFCTLLPWRNSVFFFLPEDLLTHLLTYSLALCLCVSRMSVIP